MAPDATHPPEWGEAFPKSFRLKRRRLIRPLFDRGRTDVDTVAVGCVRLLYRTASRGEVGRDVPLQIGFAPGRRARNAVERNRIKRILREVYRRHQHVLVDLFACRNDVLTVMVLYRGDPQHAERCIPRDFPSALRAVAERYADSDAPPPGG